MAPFLLVHHFRYWSQGKLPLNSCFLLRRVTLPVMLMKTGGAILVPRLWMHLLKLLTCDVLLVRMVSFNVGFARWMSNLLWILGFDALGLGFLAWLISMLLLLKGLSVFLGCA